MRNQTFHFTFRMDGEELERRILKLMSLMNDLGAAISTDAQFVCELFFFRCWLHVNVEHQTMII